MEFGIRQLVEVALRALSPGVNDPFTAIAVIDRLGASLTRVLRRGRAKNFWRDEDGEVRVLGKTTTVQGLFDSAFNQIRQAGEEHPAILIRILEILGELAEHTRDAAHRHVVTDHVNKVFAAGKRTIREPRDLEPMEELRTFAIERLEGG